MQPVAVEYVHRCTSHSVCWQKYDSSWHLKCGSGSWEELYNLWSHIFTSFSSVPMAVILWIPGFPEVYDYRVALKNTLWTSPLLCINIPKLINYLRMLKGNRWPLSWTFVQSQIQSKNLAVDWTSMHWESQIFIHPEGRLKTCSFECLSFLRHASWFFRLNENSKSEILMHREWEMIVWGQGMSLGTCEVFSWMEGGTREGPAKFVLGRLLMKASQSSCRNSQAPSSPLSEPASPQ